MFTVSPRRSCAESAPAPEVVLPPAEYLTDGVTLFRFVRAAVGGMVELEDCLTLDVLVIPGHYLARMRPVISLSA